MIISDTDQGLSYRLFVLKGQVLNNKTQPSKNLQLLQSALITFKVDGYHSDDIADNKTIEIKPTGIVSYNLRQLELQLMQTHEQGEMPTYHLVKASSAIVEYKSNKLDGEEDKDIVMLCFNFENQLYLAKAKILPISSQSNYLQNRMDDQENFLQIKN